MHLDRIYHTNQIWRIDDLELSSLPNLRDASIGDAFLRFPKLENFKSPVYTLCHETIQSLYMNALHVDTA